MHLKPRQQQHARRLNGSSVRVFAEILDRGTPTRFRYEGAIRHGIRSWLVLHGETWQAADDNAAQVIAAAFALLRVVRPRWIDGQPDYAQNEDRIFCANENCQKPIERESLQPVLYCSPECRIRAKSKRAYSDHAEENRARAAAARAAARAQAEIRHCEWCSLEFKPLDDSRRKQRFCSRACRSRFASSCATAWRPYRLPSQRDRQGRFIQRV